VAVSKITGWGAPYKSSTFRQIASEQVNRNGLMSIIGPVTQTGFIITVPPFTAIQNGLIFKKDVPTSVTSPGMSAPYFLTVTTPTPTNIDNLTFGFAQNPDDITVDTVIIGAYDGNDWRLPPLLSIDGIIEERYLENIQSGAVGPYEGLHTSIIGSNYNTTAGSLVDTTGERQTFLLPYVTPVIGSDPDWKRVDRMIYRRPIDSPNRIGTRKLVLGGTYDTVPAIHHVNNVFTGTGRHTLKTLIASDNTAHLLCMSEAVGSYTLKYAKLSADRLTVETAELDLITNIDETNFDAAIDHNNMIHIVYSSGGNIYYNRASSVGVLLGSAFTVDTQTGYCKNPRCKIDHQSSKVYIVYQSVVGTLNQIFFASRDVLSGGIASSSRLITELSGAAHNLQNPDLYIANDYVLHIVWENTTLTSIQYQKFNDLAEPYTVSPITVSSSVNHIGFGTLVNGAKNPRIIVTDNETPFISFAQDKGAGSYGISIWSAGSAFMRNLFTAGESFLSYDFYVEDVLNDPILAVGRSTDAHIVRLHNQEIDFSILCSSINSQEVSLVKDKKGSLVASWSNTVDGAYFGKTPSATLISAFSQECLSSDVLLARIAQPDALILNWILGGKPGSLYDFLLAHGTSVAMDWEVTAPSAFTLSAGLQVIDMFSNVNYTIADGSYVLGDNEALYILLDGVHTSVTPQVAPVSLIPWDQNAAVLGVIKGNQFNPALMGIAGMVQLDSGEKVIFGQDLPQSIRMRLGIIDESHFQAYTSTVACNSSDTYPQAISNLDVMAGQNRHARVVKMVGSWGRDDAGVFRLDSSCFVQIPGLSETRNEIPAGTLTLATDGDVAYVDLNRTAGSAATLTLSVATLSSMTLTRNTFIVARRIGTDLAVDSLGKSFKPGDLILEASDEALKRVRAIDRVSSTLPTGTTITVDGVALSDGDTVLFANSGINRIAVLYGVGSAISWQPLSVFQGNLTPTSKSCVQVYDGSEINRTLWSYDATRGWYRVSSYQDTAEVLAADFTTAFLPTGSSLTVDGVSIANGDLVLFGNTALNKVYRVTGIGSALSFEPMNLFRGYISPLDGSRVLVQSSDVMWEYDTTVSGWSAITITRQNKTYLGLTSPSKSGGTFTDQLVVGQINNVVQEGDALEQAIKRLDIRQDTLKKVSAVDLLNNTLPTGSSYIPDGVTFVDGDKVLFASAALNGIYQIAGVGTAISWTKLYEFGGSQTPGPKDTVFVSEGMKTNRTVWISDPTAIPPWVKLVDPQFLGSFAATIAQHTIEINELQNLIAGILANKPNFEEFTAGVGGQSIFNLSKFSVSPLNTVTDIYTFWNGRWQSLSTLGDFSDGAYRKNSSTQIEMAEAIPEGETITVYMWDPAAMFVQTIKVQKFIALTGGQSLFNLDPLIFAVEADNTIIDCEYAIDGIWQTQSIMGDFSDGSIRKNSSIVIQTETAVPAGKEFVVIRRVPVGASSGGGGGGADLTNVTTPIGFATPLSVGTLARPADSFILKDQSTSDVWKLSVSNGTFSVIKVN